MKQIITSWYAVLVGLALSGCLASSTQTGGMLQLEEHRLAGAPELEPLSFQPLQGTQEEVLAKHAKERGLTFSKEVNTFQGNPAISSIGESGNLLAVLVTSVQEPPEQTVKVMRGEKVIFETTAGLPSPVMPLQGLWTYDGHWALEILLADQSTWSGEVFIDGKLVNQQRGYDEAFALQLLAGKPFFLYRRNGYVGYSYGGQEKDLAYDDVPHYRCCSESVLNPVQASNMIAFFAMQEQTWFYVELGSFDG